MAADGAFRKRYPHGLVAAVREYRAQQTGRAGHCSNQLLKAAEARFREARALILLNRADLSPTISTGPTISANHLSQNISNSRPGNFNGYTLPLDVNYEFDAWGRVRRSIAAAREETQARQAISRPFA